MKNQVEKPTSQNQFVILEHHTPRGIHWDLMLEHGPSLWTWRIEIHPSEIGDRSIAAEHIFDHPLKFLTYQGPVQGGTSRVTMADKGALRFQHIEAHRILIHLEGKLLKGPYMLDRDKGVHWTFQKSHT